MENVSLNKTEHSINIYTKMYDSLIKPFSPINFFDENMQRIIAKALMIEQRKQRINLTLNLTPKKIINANQINFKVEETPCIDNTHNTKISVSLDDEKCLKFFVNDGINI